MGNKIPSKVYDTKGRVVDVAFSMRRNTKQPLDESSLPLSYDSLKEEMKTSTSSIYKGQIVVTQGPETVPTGEKKSDYYTPFLIKNEGNSDTSYYADRIMTATYTNTFLEREFVKKKQLGTSYTGVGKWPDATEDKGSSAYNEIFNDYTTYRIENNLKGESPIMSHVEGKANTLAGSFTHIEGYKNTGGSDFSHIEGASNTSSNNASYSHVEGESNSAVNSSYAHVEGHSNTATSASSAHVGGSNSKALGNNAFVHGTNAVAFENGISIGQSTYAKVGFATGINTASYFPGAFATGFKSIANGNYSVAEGDGSITVGQASHAEGNGSKAYGKGSHAEGSSITGSATNTGLGLNSHAENASTVLGSYAHSENKAQITETGTYAHAEGSGKAIGSLSHVEGNNTVTTGTGGHAEGIETNAYEYSHAEGNFSYAKGTYAHAEGNRTMSAGISTHAEGTYTSAYNTASHAEGGYGRANSNYSHVEGYKTYTTSNAIGGHAEGNGSYTTAEYAHAEGNGTYASGSGAHAEGNVTHANGQYAHAEGNNTTAESTSAHAEGERTKAIGQSSHAEGVSNYAGGIGSHAEGNDTYSNGASSHSQGVSTYANGEGSFASGNKTTAQSNFSSSFGVSTYANGIGSMSEGQGSITGTNATAAHAEGSYTIANNESEHAQGKYNVSDTENSGTLFTIGNGTANDKRHNVVGIYHNGDINIEGPNTTNHNTGYFKTTVDGNHTEIVRGNYTQTIGTAGKNNTCNITVNGNTINKFNGTSDTRITGATYEGYGSTFISTTEGAKYIYSYNTTYTYSKGNVTNTTAGTRTNITDGKVSITNKAGIDTITSGTTYQYTSGAKTDAVGGTRTNITDGKVSITNKAGIDTITSGTTYQYTTGAKTDAVGGTRTDITVGNVSITNKANIDTTTGGAHTESINNERSVTVGKHDSLIVSSGGKTEKITGEKITQVISGNINAYTDDTHDTRLHTRSTYIETLYAYIGDKTNTVINGNYSVGLGQGIKVSSNTNVSTGKFNKDEASYFAVGIGTSDTNRKNAFWISQNNKDNGYNGVGYFSNNTYVYGNTYDPGQYPNNKEDKSWSAVVTYNMYRNSYTYLYKTMNDKFDTFGTGTYFTKSIDPFTYTPVSYTLHYTTQTFDNEGNSWPTVKHQYVLPQAIPGALENDNSGMAGLMSARDKARLDSIWEGDKQIAGIQISTGSWQVFKNDDTTAYTLANIKHQSNSITNLKVEYGFKVKWSGTWKWTVSNQKNAERCDGEWGTTLPAVNTNSNVWTSSILSNTGTICTQTIFAKKRGLIISGYPDNFAASSNGTKHLGSIVPASGEDNRACSVSWSTYRLLFYGMCTQAQADGLQINVMKDLLANTRYSAPISGRNWTIYYKSDPSHCFFMAYPAIWDEISTIKKNGVEIITSSFLKVGTVNYTNGAGYTQQYYVYRSGVGAAGMSITIS